LVIWTVPLSVTMATGALTHRNTFASRPWIAACCSPACRLSVMSRPQDDAAERIAVAHRHQVQAEAERGAALPGAEHL